MSAPEFHIAIDGPPGMAFLSFPSSALEGGDASKITLDMVRNKCNISNKLFFTIDGKSRISDKTSLAYYMSLTAKGQEILRSVAPDKQVKSQGPAESPEKEDESSSDDEPAPEPGVRTMMIKVADPTTAKEHLPLPTKNETLSKLVDIINNGGLERGKLPTFSDRELASLAADYATAAGKGSHAEPSELTEQQWDSVLKNNRAFHGHWYDFKTGVLMKAAKPAFRLRGAAPVGKAPSDAADTTKDYFPPIPPFFVADDANVQVTEVRSQKQRTWIKESFNSIAVGGSLGGGLSSVPVSVEASYDKEQAEINQTHNQTDVSSLSVTYNFPRAVIELDPDCLELTEQCRRDAMNVTDAVARDRFYRQYGIIFVTHFTLGGYLQSTRNVSITERSSLDQVKNKTRIAAGISVQSPWASGSAGLAKVNSTTEENGNASLLQDVCLTWDAHGGDTLLCSNPSEWASTVKDHRLWRLMDQQRLVRLEHLIKDIDTIAWSKLDNPSSDSNTGRDVVKDEDFNAHVRVVLIQAFEDAGNNTLAKQVITYYQKGHYDTAGQMKLYNDFMKTNFKDEKAALIDAPKLFGGLTMDQKVGFGLYMTSIGELRFD